MKIFRLLSPLPSVLTVPDTALLIQKRPFFIPDFTQDCRAQLCAVIRITRLGRSIGERFVPRYYQAEQISLGVHFVAHDLLEQLRQEGQPWDIAVGFDNAVAVAETTNGHFAPESSVALHINEDTTTGRVPTDFLTEAHRAIAHISTHYTLRQGDLFLFPLPVAERTVAIDDHLTLSLNGEALLSFNVK